MTASSLTGLSEGPHRTGASSLYQRRGNSCQRLLNVSIGIFFHVCEAFFRDLPVCCLWPSNPQALFFSYRKKDNGLVEEEIAMRCTRCHGRMVTDYFIDMENSGELWMPGWRCLVCGEVVDPLIMKHRIAQDKAPEIVEAQTRKRRVPEHAGIPKRK